MRQHFVKFELKANYFQLGSISAKTKKIIFVLHGYGQLAKYFIRKFDILDNGEITIIAPEGLSRFYLRGFEGRVGATWMTKEDRLTDIDNYITYLNTVYEEVCRSLPDNDIKISILGFSQGCATASRWAAQLKAFHQLVLWAGIFPPDLNINFAKGIFKKIGIKYVYGLQDKYLSEDRLNEMKRISQSLSLEPEWITFDGEHNINTEVLQKIYL